MRVKTREKLFELFSVDRRTLALFRFVVALAVIFDCFGRWPDLADHYTDQGIAPCDFTLQFLTGTWHWSIHWLSGGIALQHFLMTSLVVVAICVLVGWRTRINSVLLWGLLASLQTRNPVLLNGGDVLLLQLAFWGMFLPWGCYWSVDVRQKRSIALPGTYCSAATAGVMCQVAFMYFFTALWKWGPAWLGGSALQISLADEMLVKPLGTWLLNYPTLLQVLTILTLFIELIAFLLLLCPWKTTLMRLVGLGLLVPLHLGIELSMEVLGFSWASLAALTIFIPAVAWGLSKNSYSDTTSHGPVSRPKQSEIQRWGTALGISWIGYIALYNLITWWMVGWPNWLNWLHRPAELTSAAQTWDMFADPAALRRRYLMPVRLRDGRFIDGLRGDVIVQPWKRPATSSDFDSARWMLTFRQISAEHFQAFRPTVVLTHQRKHFPTFTEKKPMEVKLIEFPWPESSELPPSELVYLDLRAKGRYVNGQPEGSWVLFNDDNVKEAEGYFSGGVQSGRWKFFFPNGRTKEVGFFKDGKMHGTWSFYSEDGSLTQAEFRDGKMIP